MKVFSLSWKKSTKARKQRKYQFNAPAHIKRLFLSAPLSKELKTKHAKKNIPVRKGDKVKVMRGQFKGTEGRVNRVDVTQSKLYIEGVAYQKKDGNIVLNPIHPSNVMIVELETGDKRRIRNEESS